MNAACPMHGEQRFEYEPAPNLWMCPGFVGRGSGCRSVVLAENPGTVIDYRRGNPALG